MSIDWSRPVRTRDGREVRIYDANVGQEFNIHGAINLGGSSGWEVRQWLNDGRIVGRLDLPSDLVNVPRRVKVDCWLNVFDNGVFCGPWTTKREADMGLGAEFRIACIHVEREVEEGEGL